MRRNYFTFGIGLSLSLILAIAIMVHAAWIRQTDIFLTGFIHAIPNLQGFMLKIAFLASPKMDLLWMLLIAVILWLKHQRPLALNIFVLLLSGDGVGWIIKHLVRRARPVQHLAVDIGYSFPSGHVLGMALIVLWLMLIVWPKFMRKSAGRTCLNILLSVWLALVMIARVYVYAHYPTDVIASLFIALMWLGLFEWIWYSITPRTPKNTF